MSRLTHLVTANTWRFAAGWTPDAIAVDQIDTCVQEQGVDGTDRLTVTIPSSARGATQLVVNRCAAAVNDDGSWDEWQVVDDGDHGGIQRTVVLAGYMRALARTPLIRFTDDGGQTVFAFERPGLTATEHLAFVLAALTEAGLTFFRIAGDVPSYTRTVQYQNMHASEGLQAIATAFACEYWFEPNYGDGTVIIHLPPQRGSDQSGGELRGGWNANIDRDRSSVSQSTALTPIGEGGETMAANRWRLTLSGTTGTLSDPNGGPGPIGVDGQLDGLYLEAKNRTTRTLLSGSLSGAQTAVLASATGFTSGDMVRVCRTADGEDLTTLTHPAMVTQHGILADPLERSDILAVANIGPNPILATWSGGGSSTPDGYTNISATLTRTTTTGLFQTAGRSCRIQTTADGRGLGCPVVPLTLTKEHPFVAGCVSFMVAAGTARIEMVATDGTRVWTFPDGISQVATGSMVDVFDLVGVAGIDLQALGATSVRLLIVQHGDTPLDCYFDGYQVTETAGQQPFSEGNGANLLWHAAKNALLLRAPFQRRFAAKVVDLFRRDGSTFAHHELILGAPHTLIDDSLQEYDTVRLLSKRIDRLIEANTDVELSSRPEDFGSLIPTSNVGKIARPIATTDVVGGARILVVDVASNIATASTTAFNASDVGKTALIPGAGVGGLALETTISSVFSSTIVTLTDSASVDVDGGTLILGSPQDVLTLARTVGGRRASEALVDDAMRLAKAAKDNQSRDLERMFAKPIPADDDDFDAIPDGPTFKKPYPLLTIKCELVDADETDTTVKARVTALDTTDLGSLPLISHNGGGAVGSGAPTDDYVDFVITKPSTDVALLVLFTATKTGCVSQAAGVVVPKQASTAAGPSLKLAITKGPASWSINASFTGTLTYRVNSDDEGDEVELSPMDLPILATKAPNGSDPDVYDFFIEQNGQRFGQSVQVPCLGPPPQIINATVTPDFSSNLLTVSWEVANAPVGATFAVAWDGESDNHSESGSDVPVTSPYVISLSTDIELKGTGGTEVATWGATVTMYDGATAVALVAAGLTANISNVI